jgi:hypothetical protein
VDDGKVLTDDPFWLRVHYQMSLLLDPALNASDWQLMHHHYSANALYQLNDHETLDWLRRALANPDLKNPDAFFVEAVDRLTSKNTTENQAGKFRYVFDLSKPLNPQFEKAKVHLEIVQEELFGRQNTRKNRTEKWPLFLRALDARDAGATYSEMMRAFWPRQEKKPESARDTHKAACHLRDNFPI